MLILAQRMVYDLDANSVTDGDVTLPLHPDWLLPSDDDDSYTSAWRGGDGDTGS